MEILVIDAWLPTPDRDGASVRMAPLLELLCEFGNVTFAPDDFAARRSAFAQVQSLGVRVVTPPQSAADHLQAEGKRYDAVFLSRMHIAQAYLPLVRTHAPQARVLFDTTDLVYLRGFRGARVLNNQSLLKRALEAKQTELGLMRAADVTLVVSRVEQEILARDCPAARVALLSPIIEPHPTAQPFAGRAGLVFVGGFPHLPNADAMQYFCDDILPRVRARLGDIPITVAGSEPPAWLQTMDSENFRVPGRVSNLALLMAQSRVSLAPLRYGAGIKSKVLVSMSYGVPVVGTTIAAEGIPVQDGQQMMIADDAGSFAQAVCGVYEDETLWQTLSANGLRLVTEHNSRAVARGELNNLLSSLGLYASQG